MNRCEHIAHRLDDYLDGHLDGAGRDAVEVHLNGCADCRRRLAEARDLRAALRAWPVPEPDPAFLRQALEQAKGVHRRGPSRPVLAAALAATLALGLALGLFMGTSDTSVEPSVQVVVLSGEHTETVHLVFHATRAVPDAEIQLSIPAHLELSGSPGVRDLRWHAELSEGANLLALPLAALHAGEDYLEASINYNGKEQRVRVALRVPHAPADGSAGPRSGLHFESIDPV
ncbi:hypothetical protein B1C78_11800 [Thioalkalivibrio denitrificans]|uniref:Putative zinc-finger domain-containing protein n=1 Tax=Thioalkalivibrio denitrificans TaxID=108003 RepID=A0A1V3NE75_9GAMM|nr:zf-HC2 domain-containing protein [Thioalkalivibrio denitrificans]OOG23294.1 hypothetical protein B1C78_11800 [Thioalkalivibrio denitrificans]